MHEQAEGGATRFLYYCTRCGCVLRVRRDLRPTYETIEALSGRCIGCGHALADGVECKLSPVPNDWDEVQLADPVSPARRNAPIFFQASSLPHFSLGFSELDSLLRPLLPGNTLVIQGPHASKVAERAAFRAQLPFERGGLDSAVLYIDGGNRSDPYLFSSFAKQWGLRPNIAMRRVTTCRVFTMYQLADLLAHHLSRALQDYATKLVVISDLLGTFNEPELDEREARRLLSAIEQGIGEAKQHALILVTLDAPSKYDDYVQSWANTAVRLYDVTGRIAAELVKHPRRQSGSTSFRLPQLLMRRAR